jgi:predicted membrane channel-forming protein YqfA (hemolysin III family)
MKSQKKTYFLPKTMLGKWSVWLNVFFMIVIITSIILVNVLGILSYDNHWWDVTVPLVFSASIAAFVIGIIAVKKNKERSVSVFLSILIGLLSILFLLLHSLFISD